MYPEMALLSANFSYDTVGGLQLLSKGTCTQSLYTESALIDIIHSSCVTVFSHRPTAILTVVISLGTLHSTLPLDWEGMWYCTIITCTTCKYETSPCL